MEYAPTSYNRTVYASPPAGGSGFRVARSFAALIPAPHSTHIFASPGNLRFPLSGLQKRHIQPGRYAPLPLDILTELSLDLLRKIFTMANIEEDFEDYYTFSV
jgi:hypothetical protein